MTSELSMASAPPLDPRVVAFEAAVHAFKTDLYRYAYGLTRDRFVAEDLVQETFARAWKAWDALKEDGSRKHWLITILRNENARRFAKKTPEHLAVDGEEVLELPAPPPAGFGADLEDLIHALPVTYREPLLLQVLGGFSCAEIASLLNTSEGAIMTRLTRARQALRSALRPERSSPREPTS